MKALGKWLRVGKRQENGSKMAGKWRENGGKTAGKRRENSRKTAGKQPHVKQHVENSM